MLDWVHNKYYLSLFIIMASFVVHGYSLAKNQNIERKGKIFLTSQAKTYVPVRKGKVIKIVPSRERKFRNVRVIRPYGHWYSGYGFYRQDAAAYNWLAFTSLTMISLDNLNENQQRIHEQAQIDATAAQVGEIIQWNDMNASGSVKVLQDGVSSSGRYCREFQHTITVGGKEENAYGTACQQPDGAWEIISTEN